MPTVRKMLRLLTDILMRKGILTAQVRKIVGARLMTHSFSTSQRKATATSTADHVGIPLSNRTKVSPVDRMRCHLSGTQSSSRAQRSDLHQSHPKPHPRSTDEIVTPLRTSLDWSQGPGTPRRTSIGPACASTAATTRPTSAEFVVIIGAANAQLFIAVPQKIVRPGQSPISSV